MRTNGDHLIDLDDKRQVIARVRAIMAHRRDPNGCSEHTGIALHPVPFREEAIEREAARYARLIRRRWRRFGFDDVRDAEDRRLETRVG